MGYRMNCPICDKELKVWYQGDKKVLGCSDIKCDYLGVEI